MEITVRNIDGDQVAKFQNPVSDAVVMATYGRWLAIKAVDTVAIEEGTWTRVQKDDGEVIMRQWVIVRHLDRDPEADNAEDHYGVEIQF